jgi:hypothetical protein
LFVTNPYNNTLGEYTLSGGTVNSALITLPSGANGIAAYGSDLFVSFGSAGSIGEYTTSGMVVNSSLITGLNGPWGVTVSGQDLFITCGNGGKIAEYTTNGALVNSAVVSGLNSPRGIVVTSRTTAYYRFETNNDTPVTNNQALTVADDSSGNGNNGTAIGSSTYVTTPFPNTIPQTGASNQYALYPGSHGGVLLSGATAPILAPTFTFEASFDLTSVNPNTGDVKPIFRCEGNGTGILAVELLDLDGSGTTDDLLVEMSNDTLEQVADGLSINTPYFVAETYDGTTAKLYLNGSLIESTPFTNFSGSGTYNAAIGDDVTGDLNFPGYIDEVRISDVALSPSQFLDVVSIPEPSSLGMSGLAIAGLLRRKRS